MQLLLIHRHHYQQQQKQINGADVSAGNLHIDDVQDELLHASAEQIHRPAIEKMNYSIVIGE